MSGGSGTSGAGNQGTSMGATGDDNDDSDTRGTDGNGSGDKSADTGTGDSSMAGDSPANGDSDSLVIARADLGEVGSGDVSMDIGRYDDSDFAPDSIADGDSGGAKPDDTSATAGSSGGSARDKNLPWLWVLALTAVVAVPLFYLFRSRQKED
jgi:hypothetical protein